MKIGKKRPLKMVLVRIVFLSLIVSVVFSVIGIILSSQGKTPTIIYYRPLRDYVLILLQCLFGISVLLLPGILEKRLKITIENWIYILFVLFLYAAIILGEAHSFYYKIKHWDTILHTFSGIMLGAIGFSVVDILDNSKNIQINLSQKFVAFFSFCFAVALGAIWEIYEYLMDTLFKLNMQKYELEDGLQLIGHYALYDTMKDLIVDSLGAFIICIIGYIMLKKQSKVSSLKIEI
jgi:hypothetical protein